MLTDDAAPRFRRVLYGVYTSQRGYDTEKSSLSTFVGFNKQELRRRGTEKLRRGHV